MEQAYYALLIQETARRRRGGLMVQKRPGGWRREGQLQLSPKASRMLPGTDIIDIDDIEPTG